MGIPWEKHWIKTDESVFTIALLPTGTVTEYCITAEISSPFFASDCIVGRNPVEHNRKSIDLVTKSVAI